MVEEEQEYPDGEEIRRIQQTCSLSTYHLGNLIKQVVCLEIGKLNLEHSLKISESYSDPNKQSILSGIEDILKKTYEEINRREEQYRTK